MRPAESAPSRRPRASSGLIAGCILLTLLLLPGCLASRLTQDPGTPKSLPASAGDFGGQWWDFYKRGLIRAEEGQASEAMTDFREAIAQRAQDQWQADIAPGRAIDYFPHRELGILHLAAAEYGKAIAELDTSFAAAPSARASFFLHQARLGKSARDTVDYTPPEISFAGSTTAETTSNCHKIIAGVVSDDTFVSSLTVGDRSIPLALPEKTRVFKTELDLPEGKNSILAVATDLSGKITEKSLEITCDRLGPRIEIEELAVRDGQILVKGNVSDENGLGSLTVNGQRWPVTGRASGYNFEFALPEGRITVVATDQAGNVTGARIRDTETALEDLAAAPRLRNANPDLDLTPPAISIDGLGPEIETSSDTLQLAGQISDDSLLVYISVNGEEIANRKGRRLFFSQKLTLREGANTLRILAADEYGNKTRRTFVITRNAAPVSRQDTKMLLALLPFAGSDALRTDAFLARMQDAFRVQGRFALAEEAKIIAAVRDMGLRPGAFIDAETAARLSRVVGAQAAVTGTINVAADGIEIVGQLIDSDNATLLARKDVFGQSDEDTAVNGLLAGLALRFAEDFPLAEGSVLAVEGKEILLELTGSATVLPRARFFCYRVSPPARHPVTGTLLPPEQELIGEVQAIEGGKGRIRARILSQKGTLVRGDRAVAR